MIIVVGEDHNNTIFAHFRFYFVIIRSAQELFHGGQNGPRQCGIFVLFFISFYVRARGMTFAI